MRILWVKAGKLLPVDTGGKIRSSNILRKLARNNPVTTLSYYGGVKDPDYEAMGKAVVSTTIGAEGLDVTSGEIGILADDASSFGDSIITLLKDPRLRRKYERTAAALAARYDWSNIARLFEDVLHDTMRATQTAQLVTS